MGYKPIASSAIAWAFRRFWDSILIRLNTAAGGAHHYTDSKRLVFDDNRIPGLTPHIFRHNFATMLYYSEVDMKEAVRLMGHSDEKKIIEIYACLLYTSTRFGTWTYPVRRT